ncbi:hypothetical protein Sango_1593200 [Sesamum angolense]|uniref:Uncharacterized protein n=1 Tax=Sesamum angolense TaxID=2727404 RepID=A0AAE2BTV2_9LAMI|nr:hypothetical protein Sango_1593200 [Sesamum angolense]
MEKKRPSTTTIPHPHEDTIIPIDGDSICKEDNGKMKFQNEDVYTSEHEKVLGNCNSPAPLFDDQNVERLYDSINGITCHHWRQKTISNRTKCNIAIVHKGDYVQNTIVHMQR